MLRPMRAPLPLLSLFPPSRRAVLTVTPETRTTGGSRECAMVSRHDRGPRSGKLVVPCICVVHSPTLVSVLCTRPHLHRCCALAHTCIGVVHSPTLASVLCTRPHLHLRCALAHTCIGVVHSPTLASALCTRPHLYWCCALAHTCIGVVHSPTLVSALCTRPHALIHSRRVHPLQSSGESIVHGVPTTNGQTHELTFTFTLVHARARTCLSRSTTVCVRRWCV
jgi:hypothetical protein